MDCGVWGRGEIGVPTAGCGVALLRRRRERWMRTKRDHRLPLYVEGGG